MRWWMLWLWACGGEPPLQVYAASSLTDAFTALAPVYEARTGEPVSFTFAGSQVLRMQIEHGAPAQVFASADPHQLALLEAQGRVAHAEVFATNELVAVVPLDNPAGIERFAQLPRARRAVIGTDAVPVGAYTRQILDAAGLEVHVVSEENNARLVRAKVLLGEADLAFIYRSDLTEELTSIDIPAIHRVRAEYPVALLAHVPRPELAAAWLEVLTSAQGRTVLRDHGLQVD